MRTVLSEDYSQVALDFHRAISSNDTGTISQILLPLTEMLQIRDDPFRDSQTLRVHILERLYNPTLLRDAPNTCNSNSERVK